MCFGLGRPRATEFRDLRVSSLGWAGRRVLLHTFPYWCLVGNKRINPHIAPI